MVGCKVQDLVRETIASLDEEATVQKGAELMAGRGLGSIIVTRDGEVVGLFTERDLLKRVVAAGRDPGATTLGEVCTRNLVSVEHDCGCRQAVQKMQAHACRRLLVHRGGRFVGLVKMTDLAHAMAANGRRTDYLVNAMGGVTLTVVVVVIAMLLFQLPAMIELVSQVSTH
jgi:signal-transduction protein with cAMP-binding, CBS, and nucleotidyltransferase domain